MLDAMASLLTFNAGMYFASGESRSGVETFIPRSVRTKPFRVSDGWINVGVANDKFWSIFCDAIGCRDLLADPRFESAPKRASNRARSPQFSHLYSSAGRAASGWPH